MNKQSTRLMLILVLVALSGFVGYLLRRDSGRTADRQSSDPLALNDMSPDLMASQQTGSLEEILNTINETIDSDKWISAGPSTHQVKTKDLSEVDESDGEYSLKMRLCWRGQELATQHRHFASNQGQDGEMEDRLPSFLACAMYANGFLSGSCEFSNVSGTEVAAFPDWTFDDKDTDVISNFNRSFNATMGGTGVIDCGNDATLIWQFVKKAPEPRDPPRPASDAF